MDHFSSMMRMTNTQAMAARMASTDIMEVQDAKKSEDLMAHILVRIDSLKEGHDKVEKEVQRMKDIQNQKVKKVYSDTEDVLEAQVASLTLDHTNIKQLIESEKHDRVTDNIRLELELGEIKSSVNKLETKTTKEVRELIENISGEIQFFTANFNAMVEENVKLKAELTLGISNIESLNERINFFDSQFENTQFRELLEDEPNTSLSDNTRHENVLGEMKLFEKRLEEEEIKFNQAKELEKKLLSDIESFKEKHAMLVEENEKFKDNQALEMKEAFSNLEKNLRSETESLRLENIKMRKELQDERKIHEEALEVMKLKMESIEDKAFREDKELENNFSRLSELLQEESRNRDKVIEQLTNEILAQSDNSRFNSKRTFKDFLSLFTFLLVFLFMYCCLYCA